jgi:hypothetical protein
VKRLSAFVCFLLTLIGVYAWLADRDPDAGKMRCNGLVELCDRRVDQVTFAGTHNSMSAGKDGWFAPDQEDGIPAQLQAGIRALLIDTQYWETDASIAGQVRNEPSIAPQLQSILRGFNNNPQPGPLLCHSFCALGYKPLADGLAEIRSFLDANRNEVLIVIVEDYVSLGDMQTAMRDSGLLKYAYAHDQREQSPWPTLRELIENDKRLVMSAENGRSGLAEWLPLAWSFIQDTPFRYPSVDSFDCRPNRGTSQNPLLLVNHWVFSIIPSQKDAAVANRYEVLKRQADLCVQQRGKVPNIIAVDFAETGDLLRVVRELNTGRR